MAILMTREEYKKQYGVDPVIPAIQSSQIDTTPAPIRMTRDEYNSIYKQQKNPSGITNFLNNQQNTVAESQLAGVEKIKKGVDLLKSDTTKGKTRGVLRLTSGAIDTAFAPLALLFNPAMGLLSKRIERITDDPNLQRFAMSQAGEKAINTAEDVVDISNIAGLYAGGKSAPKIAGEAGTALREAGTAIKNKINTSKINADISATNKLADEILNIENSYNKTSIKNTLSKDTGSASRQRIANTDVLTNIVDEDGKITYESAKNAAKAYSAQTIDGAEGVVRDLLKQEGQKINLEEIRKALTSEIYASGLEGADLVTAINGVKRELSGLKLRADELGNVPLETIHDAKISTTRNIDYSKPPEVSYRRSLANIYRKIVEDKSNIKVEIDGKTYGVRDINGELSKYYGDIERIENLGGKRVKGGRLGKYSSQIAGNIAGGAAGGFIGGPLGTAVGTIVGGEVASKLRGKQMASTFGTARGKITPKSAILEGAKEVAKGEKKVDLRIPDKKVGVPKNIPKTKEVQKLEAQIAKNVEAQKKAIKAGDFTLVATLKEIYSALVEQLKAVVKKVIEDTKEYIKNPKIGLSIEDVSKKKPTSSSKAGKPSGTKISESTPSKNSTIKSDTSQAYKGETDLTTKILKDLEGKTTVSKQYILDATNRPELKQIERDLFRALVQNEPKEINVKDFAEKVKAELLPLKVKATNGGYENINMSPELRGNIAKYEEHTWESPIKTSAGEKHSGLGGSKNYFGHTRIEDMADNSTRRVIEVQSDLYQKGSPLDKLDDGYDYKYLAEMEEAIKKGEGYSHSDYAMLKKAKEKGLLGLEEAKSKLQQYNNPTAHFRMVREEIKKAAEDGKTKLQFPTGETALKIEQLTDDVMNVWVETNKIKAGESIADSVRGARVSKPRIGMGINRSQYGSRVDNWIVSDVLENGKFKAIPKEKVVAHLKETFKDIPEKDILDYVKNCL